MKLPVVAALGMFALMIGTESAEAVVRVYNVSFSARGTIRPRATPAGNTFGRKGYLIFDTANPAQSQTVEIFRNRTYQLNGNLLVNIFPSQIGLSPADLNADTIVDREIALIGFQSGGNFSSRILIGAVPRNGFRIGNTTFFQTAKAIGGLGSITVPGTDLFSIRERWTINGFSASNPNNTNAGVALIVAFLAGRGYIQVP